MSNDRNYVSVFGSIKGGWLEWLDWAEQVAQAARLPFTYAGLTKVGKESSGKARRYSRSHTIRMAQSTDLRSMGFYSTPEDFKQLVFDWQLLLARDAHKGCLCFGCDPDHLPWDRMVAMVPELLRHIQACYGFGGCMPRLKAPPFNSVGIGTSHTSPEEDEELRRWSQDLLHTRRFEQGYFRSVFPLNILSHRHLTKQIGASDVQTKIKSGLLPGKLEYLEPGLAIWLVDENQIALARTILQENHLLV